MDSRGSGTRSTGSSRAGGPLVEPRSSGCGTRDASRGRARPSRLSGRHRTSPAPSLVTRSPASTIALTRGPNNDTRRRGSEPASSSRCGAGRSVIASSRAPTSSTSRPAMISAVSQRAAKSMPVALQTSAYSKEPDRSMVSWAVLPMAPKDEPRLAGAINGGGEADGAGPSRRGDERLCHACRGRDPRAATDGLTLMWSARSHVGCRPHLPRAYVRLANSMPRITRFGLPG